VKIRLRPLTYKTAPCRCCGLTFAVAADTYVANMLSEALALLDPSVPGQCLPPEVLGEADPATKARLEMAYRTGKASYLVREVEARAHQFCSIRCKDVVDQEVRLGRLVG